ncbi:MAG: protein phosphatase 2C domain-containing protein [Bacteroidales bacterium]|nr:protein phosphatase 2C domain-containing protein [Bacteroidales bacterium]
MKSSTLSGKIGIVARTSVGMVRQNNEDFHGYSTNIFDKENGWHFYDTSVVEQNKQAVLLVLADGMGGLEMGEEAARIAVETTRDMAYNNAEKITQNIDNLKPHFNDIFAGVNSAILKYAKEQNKVGDLGTTLIIVFIINNAAHVFWIGDSRCYLLSGGSLKPVSKDHSYVQDLVDQGKITYEQSFFHPESNIITKYMGDPKQTPIPSYTKVNLQEGDLLLLCSDGLNGMLQDAEIENHFYEQNDLSQICQNLIDDANNAGGNDNNTIILTSFGDFEKFMLLPTESNDFKETYSKVNHEPTYEKPIQKQKEIENKIVYRMSTQKALLFFALGCLFAIAVFLIFEKISGTCISGCNSETDSTAVNISNDSILLDKATDNLNVETDNISVNSNPVTNTETVRNPGDVELFQLPTDVRFIIDDIVLKIDSLDSPTTFDLDIKRQCALLKTHTPRGTEQIGFISEWQMKVMLEKLIEYLVKPNDYFFNAKVNELNEIIDKL